MPFYSYRPYEVKDFSGGIIDDYVGAEPNKAAVMENVFILVNKSIRSRYGSEVDSETDPQIPVGTQRVSTLINYKNDDKLFVHSAKKIYYRDPVSYATLQGPSSNDLLRYGDADTHLSHAQWNGHLYVASDSVVLGFVEDYNKVQKIYKDSVGDYQLRTAGLPAIDNTTIPLVITPSTVGAGTNSYLYGFYYSYEYTVGNRTFIDAGPVTLLFVTSDSEPGVSGGTNTITLLPQLGNPDPGDNYDTAVVKIQIYRSTKTTIEMHKVGEVIQPVATFVDSVTDAVLQDNQAIYTTGDIPDNDPPPTAKYVHVVGNFAYYANFKEGTDTYSSKIRQSQGLDPDSVPQTFEDEVEEEITGLSSVQDIPIVACVKKIYRIEGSFDRFATGSMSHIRISDHAGCVSNGSMVQAEKNLFWAGNDGFYVTDGYKVVKISDHINDRYKAYLATLVGKTYKIKGTFDEQNRVIHWTFSKSSEVGEQDCDMIITCDLRYGVSENMTFHIWVGGASFFPTALAVFNGELHRGDVKGYVLAFRENLTNDPKIDTGVNPSLWNSETVIWNYESSAYNMGSSHVRKVANRILLSCKNLSNVSIEPTVINDDGKITRSMTEIRWRKNLTWGDEEVIWGDSSFVWNIGGLIEEDRRLPRGGTRFNFIQVKVSNSYTNIINSTNYGTVTTNSTLKTATFNNALAVDWPMDSVDYFISFSSNAFATEHKIITRTADTITYEDPTTSIASDASQTWQVKGYRKNEVFNLNSFSLSWAFASRSHAQFSSSSSGGL